MSISKYFWHLNSKELKATEKILNNPDDPKFVLRMAELLSRCDEPRIVFSLIGKKQFIESWPKIRKFWHKKENGSDFMTWWETVYEKLLNKRKPTVEPLKELQKIGKIVRDRRIEKEMNQIDLAQRTGLKQSDLSAIERGRRNLTLETLVKICKVLEIKQIPL